MSNSNLKEMVGQAMRLNMRYYGGLIDVTRDYLSALRTLAETGLDPKSQPPKPEAKPPVAVVPPLILAAPAGKSASASFSVTNNTGSEVTADPELAETLVSAGVTVEPSGMLVASGEDAVFTLKAKPTTKMPVEVDIHGSVSIPHFGDREIPVVLRRLPAPPKPKPKRKPTARKPS